MRMHFALVAAVALVTVPAAANAATLVDVTNIANQSDTPVSLGFVAGAASTTISFAGYNPPSFTTLGNIRLLLNGTSTNLLGQTFTFTAAPSGSFATQGPAGAFGTNNLDFGGATVGSYDTFSQIVSTTIGASYTLSYLLTSSSSPNGLRVSASDIQTSTVPEPATWAMMLIGFGAIGFALRKTKRTDGAQGLSRA